MLVVVFHERNDKWGFKPLKRGCTHEKWGMFHQTHGLKRRWVHRETWPSKLRKCSLFSWCIMGTIHWQTESWVILKEFFTRIRIPDLLSNSDISDIHMFPRWIPMILGSVEEVLLRSTGWSLVFLMRLSRPLWGYEGEAIRHLLTDISDSYPLVIWHSLAMEHYHRNTWFIHWKLWSSIVMLVYQKYFFYFIMIWLLVNSTIAGSQLQLVGCLFCFRLRSSSCFNKYPVFLCWYINQWVDLRKTAENHRFSHEVWDCPVFFPLNQSIDNVDPGLINPGW